MIELVVLLMSFGKMIFDVSRMIYGGFKLFV